MPTADCILKTVEETSKYFANKCKEITDKVLRSETYLPPCGTPQTPFPLILANISVFPEL
ncbi:hypothetical protein KsCSTR_24180 [Candidatus Kuenenia stuttgartiensis]|uniref:Uncharacterized protein n=1 Tax=Kuenenia stuttgartiensis TaxID=174633 RepID=Q1Q3U5_KUEST|nr:hypothetical protein KsCSTR_24180 [Candidatus Kuenenia stuttgartiensis]CAJ74694.1 unknown protein [Candidatus Kuenenia stuttgartiensis]